MSVVLAGLRGSFDDESDDIGGLLDLVQRPTWMAHARCRYYDLPWLSEPKPCEAILAEMAAVCSVCRVQDECRQLASAMKNVGLVRPVARAGDRPQGDSLSA